MYSMGLMAGEVWAPHAIDIDLNDRLEGYFPVGEFPTVAKAREILGRLAVPFAAAHELWGWGSVEAAAATTAPVAAVADPLGALDADLRAAFESVCKRRAAFKDVKNGAREPWSDADVETVRKVREALSRSGAKTIAPLLFLTDNALRKLLKREPKDVEVLEPTANNPFPTSNKRAA
jgi:hypothetical protein